MEGLIDALHDLPSMVNRRLQDLKSMDKISRETLAELAAEENKFLEDLKLCKDFENNPYLEQSQSIFNKRHEVLNLLDNQMKNVQLTYDQIDKKISYIGTIIYILEYLHSIWLSYCMYRRLLYKEHQLLITAFC